MITSDDGVASLALPAGSLPEGVTAEDIGVQTIVTEDPEAGIADVAIQLSPDGLVLAQEATLSIVVPESLRSGGFMAFHQFGDSLEFVEGEVTAVDGAVTFSAPISHFSRFALLKPAIETSVVAVPPEVVVGDAQQALVKVAAREAPFSVWVQLDGDPSGMPRLLTFSAPTAPFDITGGEVERDELSWDPEPVAVFLDDTIEGWEGLSHSSVCTAPNQTGPDFGGSAWFTIALVERSEPIDRALYAAFETTFGDSSAADLPRIAGERLSRSVLEIPLGTTFEGWAWMSATGPSTCRAAGSAGEDPPSETTSPSDGSQPDPEGDSGDSGASGTSDSPAAQASDVVSYLARYDSDEGCYVFTMRVAGDGEATANDSLNKWYNPRFVVNNDFSTNTFSEGGFSVDVKWTNGEEGDVRVSGADREPIVGAAVTTEWLDSSTLEVIVKNVGYAPIDNSRVELSVRFQDADGNTTETYGDDAFWGSP